MCGIVGIISPSTLGISTSEARILHSLMVADTARGEDATGIFWHTGKEQKDDKGVCFYRKKAVSGTSFMTKRDMELTVDGSRLAVVHNRAATSGAKTDEEAHPFSYPNVIGVHNGTVRAWRYHLDSSDASMDSMAIMEALSGTDDGTMESAAGVLTDLESGAYSLVWYDFRAQQLRFARNKDRPMWMLQDSMRNIWFGSERRMLEWALTRASRRLERCWSIKPHHIIGLPLNDGPVEVHDYTKDLPAPATYTAPNYSYPNYNYWRGGHWGSGYGSLDDPDDVWDQVGAGHYRKTYGQHERVLSPLSSRQYITVSGAAAMKTLSELSLDAQENVASMLRMMSGMESNKAVAESGDHFLDELAVHLAAKADGGKYDSAVKRARVTAYIADVGTRGCPYGFIVVDGKEWPFVAPESLYIPTERAIKNILDKGRAAAVESLPVWGVRLYSFGDAAYQIGTITSPLSGIKDSGISLEDKRGKKLKEEFSLCHPVRVARALAGDIDWDNWESN